MTSRFTLPAMLDASPVHFTAPDGSFWSVHEIGDGPGGGRALVFVSDGGFRRVRTFPAHWRDLPADDLWSLSWAR